MYGIYLHGLCVFLGKRWLEQVVPKDGDWQSVRMHHWDQEAKYSVFETEKGMCYCMCVYESLHTYMNRCIFVKLDCVQTIT